MPPFRNRGGGARRGGGGSRLGPKLPATLMAEVDQSYGSSSSRRSNRKQQRKQERIAKRPFQNRRPAGQNGRGVEAESDDQDDQLDQPGPSSRQLPSAALDRSGRAIAEPPKKKKKKQKELTLPGAASGDAEDAEIEWLEYALRKEKGKSKEDPELSDGLDDLLDFADIIGPGGKGMDRGHADEDDGDDWDDEEDVLDDGSEDESLDSQGSGGSDGGSEILEVDLDSADDDGAEEDDQSSDSQASSSGEAATADKVVNGGEEADNNPSIATNGTASKYIPPHLRAAALASKVESSAAKTLERQKLERRAQGLLNKLSEANIESIVTGIEEVYQDNPRNDVTTAFTDLILQAIADKAGLLDSFVYLYATLIAALHRLIGMEFAAHFVHALVLRYSAPSDVVPVATVYETPTTDKESLNLLTLIAELYNVGVIGSGLVYDLIRDFISSGLGESAVEGLLKVIKCSGSQLRSDDPGALKDITSMVQDKTKDQVMTVRTRFMLETLTGIKPTKKDASQDPLKRYLSSLARKRRLLAHEPLRVSLQDLLDAEKRGKWWLVGAGWSGNPLVEKASLKEKKIEQRPTAGLDELAREQGMNTDVRRSVFTILMSSEDYLHAVDRMNALKFTEVQQRELVRVTLHCANLEKTYNPYYTLVLNQLCKESYAHRFTLQYALWDLLRDLKGGANIAKTLAYLIARGVVDLTILKGIDFTSPTASLLSFLKVHLTYLIISTQSISPLFIIPPKTKFDREALEESAEKVLSNSEVAGGLSYVLSRVGGKMGEGLGEAERAAVKKGAVILREVFSKAI